MKVELFIPMDQLSQHLEISIRKGGRVTPQPEFMAPQAVDPLSIYSNITTYTGQVFAQGAAAGGITRMVMDDLRFTTNPGVGSVTTIRFTVSNGNPDPQSVRARIRFWNADGAPLGAGLPNGPGTYYAPGGTAVGFTFNELTYAPGVKTLTGTLTAGSFPVPAGASTTLWAGLTFDNVTSTTGATDAELNNFGQGFFNPVDRGSSTNTIFETTAAGSFFNIANPPGAAMNFGGAPVANTGWELVVSSLGTTAAGVTVGGRVLTGEGRGLRSARVTITDSNGAVRSIFTGSFGRFQFEDVEPGQTYVITVASRRFNFTPHVIQVVDNVSDLELIPE